MAACSVPKAPACSPYQAMQCAPVYAAVKVLSESSAQVPAHFYARGEKGSLGRTLDHPVAELLADMPNPELTNFEFRQYSMQMTALFGNSFAWVVRDYQDYPAELWPLRPEQVSIVYDPALPLKPLYTVTGPDGQSHTLHRKDILHVRGPGTLPYRGDSPVQLNWRTISNWISMEAHLNRLFTRGARPSGMLETDRILGPEQVKSMRENMDAIYGGPESGRTLVLEGGMKWKPVAFTSVESQFSELRREQLQTVARIWRIPGLLLQDPEKSIGSTAEVLGRFFVSFTLAPLLKAWEDACEISFLTKQERIWKYYIQHDTSEFTQAESLTRWQANVAALTNGVMNVNEIRDREHYPPIEGGDVYRVPVNTAPATQQYHGQNSHLIDPNPTIAAPLQAPLAPVKTGGHAQMLALPSPEMVEARGRPKPSGTLAFPPSPRRRAPPPGRGPMLNLGSKSPQLRRKRTMPEVADIIAKSRATRERIAAQREARGFRDNAAASGDAGLRRRANAALARLDRADASERRMASIRANRPGC